MAKLRLRNQQDTKTLPKLKAGLGLSVGVDLWVTVKSMAAQSLGTELHQILKDYGVTG